ncbi:MAG: IS5 family transposase, partial [Hydrotalea sp. AMD]
MDITNEQWDLICGLIEKNIPAKKIAGRPRVDDRAILNGILWICRTGAPWKDLPDRYPPYQTCHRRFQEWVKCLLWEQILSRLAVDLKTRGKIDLAECYIDGSFSAAKKGALEFGKTKRGKGTKLMAIADRNGLPIAISTHEASTHEIKLVEKTISKRFTRTKPKRLIGDMAYDSDPLDKILKGNRIKMIAPHKTNRVKKATQDRRELRRYKNRWKIERVFAWIQQFRRCQTRFDYYDANFLGFVQLACT